MKLSEFFAGQKVFVDGVSKLRGIAGNAFSDKGHEIIVRFDGDRGYVVVTDENAHIFTAEPLN